jgi:YegS/Rv2252/BmrU family lipid kinase
VGRRRIDIAGVALLRAALIVNAKARQGAEGLEAIGQRLAAAGLAVASVQAVEDPATLPDLVRAALRAGVDRVVVGGGDGTLSAAAGVLAGERAALAVLPLGTANDFARGLRLPTELAEACAVAATGLVREVDVACAGGRPFLNAATFGLSSAATRRLSDDLKKKLGPLAYPVSTFGEAMSPTPFHVRILADGESHELDALQVVVGNGRYHGGGTLVAPGAQNDDRRLDLWALASASEPEAEGGAGDKLRDLARLARVAMLLRRGRHVEHPAVLHLRARQLAIETDPPQDLDADGESAGTTPVVFTVSPARLRVVVPPAEAGRRARRAAAGVRTG